MSKEANDFALRVIRDLVDQDFKLHDSKECYNVYRKNMNTFDLILTITNFDTLRIGLEADNDYGISSIFDGNYIYNDRDLDALAAKIRKDFIEQHEHNRQFTRLVSESNDIIDDGLRYFYEKENLKNEC